MKKSHVTSLRLSEEAKTLLRLLAQHYGVSMTAVLELLIRERVRGEEGRAFNEWRKQLGEAAHY